MAYTYSNFMAQSTQAARLAMLRLFISEKFAEGGPSVSANGKAVQRENISTELQILMDLEARWSAEVGEDSRGPTIISADMRGCAP